MKGVWFFLNLTPFFLFHVILFQFKRHTYKREILFEIWIPSNLTLKYSHFPTNCFD